MHPLVRWQFRGGIAEKDRKAFLFTNIVDFRRAGDTKSPVVIGGAWAANRRHLTASACHVEAQRGHRPALGARPSRRPGGGRATVERARHATTIS